MTIQNGDNKKQIASKGKWEQHKTMYTWFG